MTVTAKIWWDNSVSDNVGWAYGVAVDGVHDTTGPLTTYCMDDMESDTSDEDLIASLRDTLTVDIADEDITIER